MSSTGAAGAVARHKALRRLFWGALASAAFVLGAAVPRAAQSPQRPAPNQSPILAADRATMIACLRQSGRAPQACIGAVAVPCVREGGPTRSDAEQGCAKREEAIWRERLNQVLHITARPLDAGQRSRLAALHLSWESYIAQKCAFYRARQAASVQMGRQAGCELREVAVRTLELQRGLPQAQQRRPQQPPRIIR